MAGRIRVFIATSLDGFIAGPADELDWLPSGEGMEDTYTPFFAQVGAMLMGRRTYDVVANMDVDWPYAQTPVLVPTSRPLEGAPESVTAVSGPIEEIIDWARAAAGDRDVYIDGGNLIRQALAAGLIDDMTLTIIPAVLGAGIPLFAGSESRHTLQLVSTRELGAGAVELVYRP